MGNKSYTEVSLGGDFFGLANTKWSYNKKSGEVGYDNKMVKLDEESMDTIVDCIRLGEIPRYMKQLDALFFGYSGPSQLISPYGQIKLPENLNLSPCMDIPAGMTAAALFAVLDTDRHLDLFYEMSNFIAVRDEGDGKYSWAYLFPKWGMKTKTQADETGYRLMLLKKGKSPTKPEVLSEIRLPIA